MQAGILAMVLEIIWRFLELAAFIHKLKTCVVDGQYHLWDGKYSEKSQIEWVVLVHPVNSVDVVHDACRSDCACWSPWDHPPAARALPNPAACRPWVPSKNSGNPHLEKRRKSWGKLGSLVLDEISLNQKLLTNTSPKFSWVLLCGLGQSTDAAWCNTAQPFPIYSIAQPVWLI